MKMNRSPDFVRPEVLAHRMLILGVPENTILALKEAAKLNIDWIEFDVHELKDGTMVSMHDSTVDRTTDGSGPLSEMTYEQLEKLNAGKGYNFGFVPVPTVEDIIKELSRYKKEGKIIKAEMHIHGFIDLEALTNLLRKYDVTDICYFNLSAVVEGEYLRNDLQGDDLHLSFNVAGITEEWREICKSLNVDYLCCPVRLINPDSVGLIHSFRTRDDRAVYVHCYPVQNEQKWQEMLDYGVDVIQTDFPEALIEWLEEKGFDFSVKNGVATE